MPNFYRDDQRHVKAVVDKLGYDLEPSILIGGWASWLHMQGAMSADIDTIITSDIVRSKLSARIADLSSNTVHQGRKLRGTVDGVHIDVYLPYESLLGEKLLLRVEVLSRFISERTYNGWQLLSLEAHLCTKLAALLDRPRSAKGQKDATEILAILHRGVSPTTCVQILLEATAGDRASIPDHITSAFTYLTEIAGNAKADRQFLASTRKEWLAAAGDT